MYGVQLYRIVVVIRGLDVRPFSRWTLEMRISSSWSGNQGKGPEVSSNILHASPTNRSGACERRYLNRSDSKDGLS